MRFKKPSPPPPISARTDFPAGLVVQTEDGTYYFKGKFRYRVYSERVLQSWNFTHIVQATESAIRHVKNMGRLGFRDGTLIHNIADGKMYLVSNNLRCHIISPDVFTKYGLDRSKAVLVSEAEANLHEDGVELD